jgi:hypothetical protein
LDVTVKRSVVKFTTVVGHQLVKSPQAAFYDASKGGGDSVADFFFFNGRHQIFLVKLSTANST